MGWFSRKKQEAPPASDSWRDILNIVLIGIAAARCWRSLSLGDSQLLAAWAASAVVLPAWRRFAPAHYNNSRYRKPLEAALRLANTASPTAVAMGVLSADKTAAGLQRLITAGLLVAGVLTSKGGLWGGLHGVAFSRPFWQQLPAPWAIWQAKRRYQKKAAST